VPFLFLQILQKGEAEKQKKDFTQFLHITKGSLSELETQLLLTKSLYPDTDLFNVLELIESEHKMLSGMINSLKPDT